jgi:heat shock protein HslJ
MRISVISLAAALLATLVLVACGDNEETPIEGKTWALTAIEANGAAQPILPGTVVTAVFDAEKNQVTGSAGCNNYFGGYKRIRLILTFPSAMGATRKFCGEPEGLMRQEQDYLTTLAAGQSYEIKGGELRITGPGKTLVFRAQ